MSQNITFSNISQLMLKIQEITNENKILRKAKEDADDLNFNLQASLATTEAESNFLIESEIAKKSKELNFKVCLLILLLM